MSILILGMQNSNLKMHFILVIFVNINNAFNVYQLLAGLHAET